MSWKTRLRQFDQAALTDLTNAGLMRRAQKLCESGSVALSADNEESGVFCIGDNTVKLVVDFPERVSCDCKTAGICVHILAAVLQIQQADTQVTHTPEANGQEQLLTQELLTFSQQAIIKWAGKTGCRQAEKILLAHTERKPQCTFDTNSLEIILDDEVRCRYVAGGELSGIICSAPESRRKGIIAACLLAWRESNGEEISWPDETTAQPTTLSPTDKQLLQELKTQLDNLLQAGLMHSTAHQIRSLRTLAWSARGESFPQISALVLHLVGALSEFQQRSAKIDTRYLLDIISRLWFEFERIHNATEQQLPALKGQARRNYEPRKLGKLWVLGASQYSTLSSAKGVSLVLWDINHARSYQVNIGRTAESALSLDIQKVWEITLPWGKGISIQRLAGKVITLSQAKVSADNRISLSKDTTLESVEDMEHYASQIRGLGITHWSELKQNLEATIVQSTPQLDPIIIRPEKVFKFVVDEYEQQWLGWAQDTQAKLIKITLPVNTINDDRANRLNQVIARYGKNIRAIVLEPSINVAEISFLPVSVVLQDNNTWLCFSPDFEFFQNKNAAGLLSKWISKIINPQIDTAKLTMPEASNVEKLFQQINELIFSAVELGLVCNVKNDTITEIALELQTANATFLASVFEKMSVQSNTDSLLTAYYSFALANRRLALDRIIRDIL